jgi:hypothetical protein
MMPRVTVVKGPDAGQSVNVPESARTAAGAVLLGRASRAALRLSDPNVSVEHAQLTRDEDTCLIENLSAHGTLVNDVRINGRVRLRHHDRITLAPDTQLRYDAPDGTSWLSSPLALCSILGVVLVALIVFGVTHVGGKSAKLNWDLAERTLANWVDEEIGAGRLPPETHRFMADGWRLEQGEDYKAAQAQWWSLRMILDDPKGQKRRFVEADEADPDGLSLYRLLTAAPGAPPDPDAMPAALRQFARKRFDAAARKAPVTGWAK